MIVRAVAWDRQRMCVVAAARINGQIVRVRSATSDSDRMAVDSVIGNGERGMRMRPSVRIDVYNVVMRTVARIHREAMIAVFPGCGGAVNRVLVVSVILQRGRVAV